MVSIVPIDTIREWLRLSEVTVQLLQLLLWRWHEVMGRASLVRVRCSWGEYVS